MAAGAAALRKLVVVIGGDAKGAQDAFNKVDGGARKAGGGIGTFAKVAAGGALAAGAALGAFAAKSASTFASVGGEVLKLQRYTGATAEEASRLRFAAKESGVDIDVLTKSLGILSKNIVGTKLDKLGLGLKDAHGHALPLNDSLLKIAERISKMPNGVEKTALAMQLFGKAGAQMLPFLNKGAEGIRELTKESDKFGETLSAKDTEAVKENTKNKRLLHAAMEGLQIQVGRYVLPIFTKFTTFLATNMPQAIAFVRKVMERLAPTFVSVGKTLDTAFKVGAKVIKDDLVPALVKVGDWLNKHQPIIKAIAALIGGVLVVSIIRWGVESTIAAGKAVYGFVKAQFEAVQATIKAGIAFAQMIAGYVATGLAALASGAQMAAAWIIGLGPIALVIAAVAAAAYLIVTHWQQIVDAAKAVWHWIADNWPLILAILTGPIGLAVRFIVQHWQDIKDGFTAVKDWIGDRIGDVVGFFTALPGRIGAVISTLWDGFRTGISDAAKWVGDRIGDVVSYVTGMPGRVVNTLSRLWNPLKDGITAAHNWVHDKIWAVIGFVEGMPGRIKSAASGMWDGIRDAFKSAINAIIRGWNKIQFKIPGFSVGPVHFGGFTLGLPDIPQLAAGGIIRPTLGGILARLGEAGSSEAVLPLTASGLAPLVDAFLARLRSEAVISNTGGQGGGVHIAIDLTNAMVADEQALANLVTKVRHELEQVFRRNGALSAVGF